MLIYIHNYAIVIEVWFGNFLVIICSEAIGTSGKMTIIVFLIDTSASMNQQAFSGGHPTLLDVAKGAVETFVKVI